jgi:hypothetical protein
LEDHMLTDKFADAFVFAEALHRRQTRKCNDIPYVAHLMAVAAMVLEWGGDEDAAIAALLHDAVEDQGGLPTAERIRDRFGPRVADIVLACTDSLSEDPNQKEDWEERKRHHIEKLRTVERDVALVTAADKLHNLTAIIRDVRRDGRGTLGRFKRPDRLVWYFEQVAEALDGHSETVPVSEIRDGARVLAGLRPEKAKEPLPHWSERPDLYDGYDCGPAEPREPTPESKAYWDSVLPPPLPPRSAADEPKS